MNSMSVIDLETWKRRRHFEFYMGFDCAMFNITLAPGIRPLYDHAKLEGKSFFLLTLYAISKAVNAVPQFRQRQLDDGRIVEFHALDSMTPVIAPDEQFTQVMLPFSQSFSEFSQTAAPLIAAAKSGDIPQQSVTTPRLDFICASCLPWFSFVSISQAKLNFTHQAIPALAWGKMTDDFKVPLSIQLHHAFVDGLHVGRFYEELEESFMHPESL